MNAVIRAVRTYAQTLVGLILVSWVDVGSLGDALTIGKAALVASVPAALALVQNLLEDNTSVEVPK
jgi:hypothetical protein